MYQLHSACQSFTFDASHSHTCWQSARWTTATQSCIHCSSICHLALASGTNAAACLSNGAPLSDHITHCDTLQWPAFAQCIEYKIVLMSFSCVHGTCPAYFHSMSSSCFCQGPCDAEIIQLCRTHWALHKEKILWLMNFPCCCTNYLKLFAKTLVYWWY